MISQIVRRGGDIRIYIAASVRSPDLKALAIAAGWMPHMHLTCIVNGGVNIASWSISGFAHDAVSLINYGTIGGVANGGVGLSIGQRITITNSGTIFGGGGVGGVGGGATATQSGGGTINAKGGAGGSGAGFTASGPVSMLDALQGGAGQRVQWSGTVFPGDTRVFAKGGGGGDGGAIGVAGTGGGYGSWGGSGTGAGYVPAAAGQPGAAVSGNSLITWLALGTITGARIG